MRKGRRKGYKGIPGETHSGSRKNPFLRKKARGKKIHRRS